MSDVQMNFDHSSLTDVGKVRKANEDNCGDRMTTNGYVFTVCDGMGGHVGGATASKIAIDSILNFFDNPVQNIYVGINDALRYANTQVYNAALENPELKGMGTTATILLINSTDCYIGHVGDSRIYLKSAGKLNRMLMLKIILRKIKFFRLLESSRMLNLRFVKLQFNLKKETAFYCVRMD